MGYKKGQCKCPTCGGFGSASLGGYCKTCKKVKDEKRGYIVSEYPGYGFHEGEFISKDDYGVVKDHYGYERK